MPQKAGNAAPPSAILGGIMKNKKLITTLILVLAIGCLSVGSFFIGRLTSPDKSDEKIAAENAARAQSLLESKIRLSCDENGDFTTMILADVHATGPISMGSREKIKMIVDEEEPDLIIFTGDNACCQNEEELRKALDSIVGYIEEKQIPWCHVYGNHDHEGGMTKAQMQAVYESYPHCLSKWGDKSLTGVGNYVLPIYEYESDDISSLVWCLDSGNYLSEEDEKGLIPVKDTDYSGWTGTHYDYIHADQIAWYYQSSQFLEEYYNDFLPSIMAFHIPLQETYYAWQNRSKLSYTGEKNDPVGASQINSGLFTALVERGDVLAVVNGHDHINDYMVEYMGIKLCYSPVASTHGYHDDAMRMLGSRIFKTNSNDPYEVETYVHYMYRE